MDRDPLEDWAVHEEVVDTRRVQALEEVVAVPDAEVVLEAPERVVDGVEQVRADGVVHHSPTLFAHPGGGPLDDGVVEGPWIGASR